MSRTLAVFVGIQLAGGLLGFLSWALLGRISPAAFETASLALAIGMLLYLPLTLGLGALLPNYFRSGTAEGLAVGRRIVTLSNVVGVSAAIVGVVVSAFGAASIGPAMAFAGLISTSALLQQLARIDSRLGQMALASVYNGVLPLTTALGWMAVGDLHGAAVLSASTTALVVMIVAFQSSRLATRMTASATDLVSGGLATALRAALPLIPHLFAFAILTQGLRVSSLAIDDGVYIAQANVVMLCIGLAYAVMAAVNGYLAVAVQKCSEKELDHTVRRTVSAFSIVGALGAVALPLFYAYIAPILFPVAALLGPGQLALLAAIPPLMCIYYLASALMLRRSRAAYLSVLSVPVTLVYVVVSIAAATREVGVNGQLLIFACATAAMAGGVAVVARLIYHSVEAVRFRSTAWMLMGLVPVVVLSGLSLLS